MNLIVPPQNLFKGELRFAVRIDWTRLRSFLDWQAVWRTEDRSVMAFIQKQFCANAPDITSAANNENFHALGKCGVPRFKSKRPEKSSLLRDSFPSFFLKSGDHLPHAMVFATRREHF